MESSDAKHGSQSVRVAVNIRPLVTTELLVGCSDCTSVTPGEPQVNRDPVTAQVQRMKNQIEQLQAEPFEELQILKQKIALLETSNADLQNQLQEHQVNVQHLTKQALDAQDVDLLKTYVAKVQELEGELLRLRRLNTSKRNELIDFMDLDDNVLHPKSSLFPESDLKATEVAGDSEVEVKKLEHCSLQEKLDNELKELDKKLEQKEAEMKRYEKKVQELEIEKRKMQKEIEQLMCKLANISSTSDDSTQKMKESYLQKLNFLESQVAELKKKQDAHSQLLRQKQKSDDAAKKKLQDEIHRIKTQKVQLQQKIKQESEQFRLWKASREKEVLQLRKEGRRNEYEMHKLLALNQRQKMVLQRKTEEASMATKRLKELLESRKASSRDTYGNGSGPGFQVLQRKTEEASMATKRLKELLESRKASSRGTYGNGSGPGFQALMQAIEHELEVTVRVHQVRCQWRSLNQSVGGSEFTGPKFFFCISLCRGVLNI